MTIQDLGSIGELIAAIATIATLVYLAIQIRQNTAQQKLDAYVSVQHGQNSVVDLLRDPDMMRASDLWVGLPLEAVKMVAERFPAEVEQQVEVALVQVQQLVEVVWVRVQPAVQLLREGVEVAFALNLAQA